MEKLLVSGMAAFIAVFMVVVLMATFFTVLVVAAVVAATVWLLVVICRAYCKPVTANEPDPSPLYLRRWTTMRRWDANQEKNAWNGLFAEAVIDAADRVRQP